MSGTLFVVATPIGNLEDVSARALRVLREVALIAAEDTRRTSKLLARYGIRTSVTSLHQHNERAKSTELIRRLTAGESIALVSDAGTPTVSDPGGILISAAIDAGARIEPVPGPSALLALLSVSGLPTDTFTFLGFPPNKASDRNSWVQQLRNAGRTTLFFEAPHRIRQTLTAIALEFGECHIVVGRELTKSHEEVVRGPVSEVLGRLAEPIGEFCVAVNLCHLTDSSRPPPPGEADVVAEFGRQTEIGRGSRRRVIAEVAKKFGIPANDVYQILESSKRSVE